jgi:hypothetical protein
MPMFSESNIREFLNLSFLQNLFFFVLGLLGSNISWFRQTRLSFFIILHFKKIPILIFRKKYILVWNDHNIDLSKKIIHLLQDKCPNYRFVAMKEPNELLKYPLKAKYIHEIILMVTDVTKLAELENKRNLLQEKLRTYVVKGGMLFGTHDLIYRRCRNKILQDVFGCEIHKFVRINESTVI